MIVFVDEAGLSERPTRVRTWAPRGRTPLIRFHFGWTHVSAIAALSRSGCMFRLHKGSIRKEQHVEFLKAHRSALVRDYVASTDGDIEIAFLPPYAPDLNPVEYLWAWLKRHALANFCAANLAELKTVARAKLKSAQQRASIISSCWAQAGMR